MSGRNNEKQIAVREVSLLDLAREINPFDYNSFITTPASPK